MTENKEVTEERSTKKLCCDLHCFEKYENFEYVNEIELKHVINYICGNLNSFTLNYHYWYDMYSYTSKNLIVLRKKKEKGCINPSTKLGECVCQGKIINFLENPNKECFCDDGCASLYYKVVF